GMGEGIGLFRLTDLVRSTDKTFVLKQSRTVRADDLKSRNVILLGEYGLTNGRASFRRPKTSCSPAARPLRIAMYSKASNQNTSRSLTDEPEHSWWTTRWSL